MERLKTKVAEKIYSVLEKYADASPGYYDREGFIYSFGVIPNPPRRFSLSCIDGRKRTFIRKDNVYFMKGKGEGKVNSIIKKLTENGFKE